MKFLRGMGRIVDSSLSLRKKGGEAQEQSHEGLGWVGDFLCDIFVDEFGAVGVGGQVARRDAGRTLKTSSSSAIPFPVFLI